MVILFQERMRFLLKISVLTIIAFVIGCDAKSVQEKQIKESVEYKLLSVDKGSLISVDDPNIPAIAAYLDELSKIYNIPRNAVANMSWVGCKELKQKGIDEPITTFLKNMIDVSRANSLGIKYENVVAMYVVQRSKK